MNIIKKLATNNRCYQTSSKFTVKGLVLHSIGCPQPSAKAMSSAYNQYKPNGASVCVHAFLDDSAVYQIMPWNQIAWHIGGSANNTHIGVEMCEPKQIKYIGGATFTCSDVASAKQYVTDCYNNAVELFAYLCKNFNLDPKKDIISHAEAHKKGIGSNHGDPEHLWNGLNTGYTMDGFREDVYKVMNSKEFYPVLSKGDTGAYVGKIQELLIKRLYDCGVSGADKSFGNATEKAVNQFKKDNNMPEDGVVTEDVWKKLEDKPQPPIVEKTEAELAVECVKKYGIMSGYTETDFGGKDPVTRDQLARIIYRMIQKGYIKVE